MRSNSGDCLGSIRHDCSNELTAARLEGRDAVVLLDVADLNQEQVKALESFVRRGGGLVIAPGAAAKSSFYNDHLSAVGLMPAKLGAIERRSGTDAVTVVLEPESFSVPWLQRFQPGSSIDLMTARFSEWWRLESLKPDLHQADESAPAAESGANPVTAAAFTGNLPWLVTRRVGEGHVALLAAPLDSTWSTLPSKNDFVPFLHELLFSMTSRGLGRVVEPGMPLDLPLARDATAAEIRFRTPDGAEHPATSAGDSRQSIARYSSTVLPGVYEAVRPNRAQAPPEYFVVDFDRAESDLSGLSDADRGLLAADDRIRLIRDLDEWTSSVEADAPRAEVWWIALLAVLALLVFEVAMTRRLVLKGHGLVDADLAAGAPGQS